MLYCTFEASKNATLLSHRRRLFSSSSCAPNSPSGILAISNRTWEKQLYLGVGIRPFREKCTLAPLSCCEPPKRRRTMGLRTGETPLPPTHEKQATEPTLYQHGDIKERKKEKGGWRSSPTYKQRWKCALYCTLRDSATFK